jgi:hypothetical protein
MANQALLDCRRLKDRESLKAAHCLPTARRRLAISDPDAVTLVTLSDVTDTATMQVKFPLEENLW